MADLTPPDRRPRDVAWRDEDPPEGKLDLLLSLDFRMTSSTLLSDIVLPAATWYEKHDLNTTDMHPFVHAFSPAIDPPFESRTDFDAFHAIGRRFSELARTHLGVRRDVVAVPLQHDTPGETAQPGGRVLDWRAGEVEAVPGRTMPNFVAVERDYPAVAEKMAEHRAAGRPAGDDDQSGDLPPRRGDRLPVGEERRDARRCGRRPPGDRHRRQDGRGRSCAVRDDQRAPRGAGLPRAGAAHRYSARRPCRGQRGEAHHLRRHTGPPGPGDHQPRVVGQRDRRPALRPVHGQRRAGEAMAHPHRSDAFPARPRLDARDGRDPADLPRPAGHAPAVRRRNPRGARRRTAPR